MKRQITWILAGIVATTAMAGCTSSTETTAAATASSSSSAAPATGPGDTATDDLCTEASLKILPTYLELSLELMKSTEAADPITDDLVNAVKKYGTTTAGVVREQAAEAADPQVAKDLTAYADELSAAASTYTAAALTKDLLTETDEIFFTEVDHTLLTKHCPDVFGSDTSESPSPSA